MRYTDRVHLNLLRGAIAVAIVALLYGAGVAERDRLNLEQRQYCDMVDMYRASGGELGWPDYAHSYRASCPPAGAPSGSTGHARPRGVRLP